MSEQEQRQFFQWLQDWIQTPASKKLLRKWLSAKQPAIQMWDNAGAKAYQLYRKSRSTQKPR